MTTETIRSILTAAGHTQWASLNDPADQPRFVVFNRKREILVGLNLAAPTATRNAVMDSYAAALASAGVTAEDQGDGYLHAARQA